MRKYWKPAQVAELVVTSHDRVLDLIASGELVATRIGRRGAKRETYRISDADLEDFLLRRRTQPPSKRQPRRRKLPAVTQYV